MQRLFFWNSWPDQDRRVYVFLLGIFLASLLVLAIIHVLGLNTIIHWEAIIKADETEIVTNTLKTGPYELAEKSNNYVLLSNFTGSDIGIQYWQSYVFLGMLMFCAMVLLTIITHLNRFWYFAGMGLFLVFLVNFKLELLMLFGSHRRIGLLLALILYLPLSFYFQSVRPNTTFALRLAIFLVVTAVLGLIIFFFSQVERPFLYLTVYGFIAPLILAILFTFMVAHEIMAGFMFAITRSAAGKDQNNFWHFLLISLFYLFNLALAYAHEMQMVDWDFYFIDLYLLLGISAILGIWGFSQREDQYPYLNGFFPLGGYAYLSFGVICFATISYFSVMANDPVLEVIRDCIVYGHLGFGAIFLIYIISNFRNLLVQGLQVYKVIYNPKIMPYFTYRLMGIIAVVGFFAYANWQMPILQSTAGYFNGLGDLYKTNQDYLLAEAYYNLGAEYGRRNHRSNYALAHIAEDQRKTAKAIHHYQQALKKWPTEYSYINLSEIYLDQDRFFDALFNLQEGLLQFPESAPIQNNLGLLYSRTDILDTALLYLHNSAITGFKPGLAGSNFLGISAKNQLAFDPDSLLNTLQVEENEISRTNLLAFGNFNEKLLNFPFPQPKDSIFNLAQVIYLHNNFVNHRHAIDSGDIQSIGPLLKKPQNANFRNLLQDAVAKAYYWDNQVSRAFETLRSLAADNYAREGEYYDLLGFWSLQQGAPKLASEYFAQAFERGFAEGLLHYAIALTEAQDPRARETWQRLKMEGSLEQGYIADASLYALNLNYDAVLNNGNDRQRYQFAKYVLDPVDTLAFKKLSQTFQDENYRALAILEMSRKHWRQDHLQKALNCFTQLTDLRITDSTLYQDIQHFELLLLAETTNPDELARLINQTQVSFPKVVETHKIYFAALIDEASGNSLKAESNYQWLATKNPFFEPGILAAADFYRKQDTDHLKAYNVLLEALNYNPYSVKILKAYILECAKLNLTTYSRYSLETLSGLISKDEMDPFYREYLEILEQHEDL